MDTRVEAKRRSRTARSPATKAGSDGGGIFAMTSPMILLDSTVSGNTPNNCGGAPADSADRRGRGRRHATVPPVHSRRRSRRRLRGSSVPTAAELRL